MSYVLRFRGDNRAIDACRERQELAKPGLTRRDLVKPGPMTGRRVGGGRLVAEKSLARDLRSPSSGTLRLERPPNGRPAAAPAPCRAGVPGLGGWQVSRPTCPLFRRARRTAPMSR